MCNWSKNHNNCVSCSTDEWNYKARGLCIKCYQQITNIEKVSKWTAGDESTYKTVGPIDKDLIKKIIKWGKLKEAKGGLTTQFNIRLHQYKKYNNPGVVDPLKIESLLKQVASLSNNLGRELFHGAQARYDNGFTNQQRQIIYRDLMKILINQRFRINVFRYIM